MSFRILYKTPPGSDLYNKPQPQLLLQILKLFLFRSRIKDYTDYTPDTASADVSVQVKVITDDTDSADVSVPVQGRDAVAVTEDVQVLFRSRITQITLIKKLSPIPLMLLFR